MLTSMDKTIRLGRFASTTIQLLGIVEVMTQVTWQILLLIVPMEIACIWMQKYYLASCKELVRLLALRNLRLVRIVGILKLDSCR